MTSNLVGGRRPRFWRHLCLFADCVLVLVGVLGFVAGAGLVLAESQAPLQTPPAPPPTAQAPKPTAGGRVFQIVVIDPGHGGTDTGARGSPQSGAAGLMEKDLTLAWAKRLRSELQSRLNLTVLLTRDRDIDPSLDERAAIANSSQTDLFLSLHLATAGPPRRARVYIWRGHESGTASSQARMPMKFIPWESAQMGSLDESERFAGILAAQVERVLPGSPAQPAPAPVRALRSVVGPAVAIEVSSVSAKASELAGIEQTLASAVIAAIRAFKPGYERTSESAAPKPAAAEVSRQAKTSPEPAPGPKPAAAKPEAAKP